MLPCVTTKVGKSSVGNGLGLAIIYSIVEKLGGGIFVETALERGTTFSIYLPYEERTARTTGDTGRHIGEW